MSLQLSVCTLKTVSHSIACTYLVMYTCMVQYYGTMHRPNTIYATKTYKAKIWLDEVFHDL